MTEIVRRFARQGRNHDEDAWRASLAALSPEQLSEIAYVYERLAQPGEMTALLHWIYSVAPTIRQEWRAWQQQRNYAEEQGHPTPPEPPQESLGESALDLFEELASLGREPFIDRRVKYEPPPPEWDRLPRELQYLKEPAERWGKYQFYEQVDQLQRTIKPEERAELQALAERLRTSKDWWRAMEWSSGQSWVDHPEAALLHWLLELLKIMAPDPSQNTSKPPV